MKLLQGGEGVRGHERRPRAPRPPEHPCSGASELGEVTVLLLTDEAIASYKRVPYLPRYAERKVVVENIKGVSRGRAADDTGLLAESARLLPLDDVVRPATTGAPVSSRRCVCRVIDTLAEWGGKLVEPSYTPTASPRLSSTGAASWRSARPLPRNGACVSCGGCFMRNRWCVCSSRTTA